MHQGCIFACGATKSNRQRGGFFAVFGTRGATIYYERCNFPNMDVLSCFYVSYPAAEKAKWDAIVTRIGQSLRFALRGSQ